MIMLFQIPGMVVKLCGAILQCIGVTLHRRNLTVVRHRCAQCCDSENEHSAVTAMVRIVMLQC